MLDDDNNADDYEDDAADGHRVEYQRQGLEQQVVSEPADIGVAGLQIVEEAEALDRNSALFGSILLSIRYTGSLR